MREILSALAVVIIAGLAVVGLSFGGYYSYKYFAPKYEQVRYDTFKESQTYNDGMVTDLEDLKREYLHANPEQKKALKSLIQHRFAAYDERRLPSDLLYFKHELAD